MQAPHTPTPAPAQSPAWTDRDLRDNPHQVADKPERVRRMFAAIAGSYDLNNRVHSLGMDQSWRRTAVRMSRLRVGDVVLDVACGTGDLSEMFARATPRPSRVLALDFTLEMLQVARVKLAQAGRNEASPITYMQGDAQELPVADAAADVISIAFGIRNVLVPERAIREFWRVLRPGGRLVILELSEPGFPPVRAMNRLYSQVILPRTATWISGDKSGAYKYLPKSIQTFLSPAQMTSLLTQAGFAQVTSKSLGLGVCRCFAATKPG